MNPTEYDFIEYAKAFTGVPYIFGANGGGAFDCGSFVSEPLKAFGFINPHKDYYSQSIYDELIKNEYGSGIRKGSILFFGESRDKISHVAIALDNLRMIEAGGGDSTTKMIEDSIKRGAMVRIRPIVARKDLVASIRLF